jgi:hypothetical protein
VLEGSIGYEVQQHPDSQPVYVCWRGVLGCVGQWVQQPTSQPIEARQKRNWAPEKGFNS